LDYAFFDEDSISAASRSASRATVKSYMPRFDVRQASAVIRAATSAKTPESKHGKPPERAVDFPLSTGCLGELPS
jgi:hypothetical protein